MFALFLSSVLATADSGLACAKCFGLAGREGPLRIAGLAVVAACCAPSKCEQISRRVCHCWPLNVLYQAGLEGGDDTRSLPSSTDPPQQQTCGAVCAGQALRPYPEGHFCVRKSGSTADCTVLSIVGPASTVYHYQLKKVRPGLGAQCAACCGVFVNRLRG